MIIGKTILGTPLASGGKAVCNMTDVEYFNHKIVRGFLLNAEEVWAYNPQNRSFECFKNRNGKTTMLMSFLISKGIHIRPDATELNNLFRFESEKDHFLFQLKF